MTEVLRHAFMLLALVSSACVFGPGETVAPDAVGSDTSPAEVIAVFDRLPEPSDRPPFPTPQVELVRSGDLMVPPGFIAERLLRDGALEHPTSLSFAPDGSLTVALQGGAVASVDARTGETRELARGFKLPLGILWALGSLYVSDDGTVWRLRDGSRTAIVTGIPTLQHQTDGLALGPDGRIYLGVGATCNACNEKDPRSASIVRFSPEGGQVEVFARGFRNPYDLAFNPADGSLWATDNGRDDLGTQVPDELNLVQQGKHYGWPDCSGRGRGSNCSGTVRAVLELEANSSSDGLAFYDFPSRRPQEGAGGHDFPSRPAPEGARGPTGFPAEYRGNAFIAQWGSFRRTRGRQLVRVVLVKREGRYAARETVFATGFDAPLDVVVGPADGALYVADHGRGTIYRIRWQG